MPNRADSAGHLHIAGCGAGKAIASGQHQGGKAGDQAAAVSRQSAEMSQRHGLGILRPQQHSAAGTTPTCMTLVSVHENAKPIEANWCGGIQIFLSSLQAHALLADCKAQAAGNGHLSPSSGADSSAASAPAAPDLPESSTLAAGDVVGSSAAASSVTGNSSAAVSSDGGHSSSGSDAKGTQHTDAASAASAAHIAPGADGEHPPTHCFADSCISPTSDLSATPQQPRRQLRVCSSPPAEGPATPEQVAHIVSRI